MTDCQCPSHVAQRAAAEAIFVLGERLISAMNEAERLRAGIRSLSELASLQAEEAITIARDINSRPLPITLVAEHLAFKSLGEASAYAAMAEKLEALLPEEIRA